jgi:hypothetical protein
MHGRQRKATSKDNGLLTLDGSPQGEIGGLSRRDYFEGHFQEASFHCLC